MANRFSEIAKQMGAKMDEETQEGIGQEIIQDESSAKEINVESKSSLKSLEKPSVTNQEQIEIPTTRKTTALPLVLDIAIKEVKERRNIANKINKSKKITEDDVVIEALETYFNTAENKSYLEAAYEKLKYLG